MNSTDSIAKLPKLPPLKIKQTKKAIKKASKKVKKVVDAVTPAMEQKMDQLMKEFNKLSQGKVMYKIKEKPPQERTYKELYRYFKVNGRFIDAKVDLMDRREFLIILRQMAQRTLYRWFTFFARGGLMSYIRKITEKYTTYLESKTVLFGPKELKLMREREKLEEESNQIDVTEQRMQVEKDKKVLENLNIKIPDKWQT